MDILHIDCDGCRNRGPACSNCVVGVLIDGPDHGARLTAEERQAVAALAGEGLVPPLRLAVRPRSADDLPSRLSASSQ